MANVHFQKVLTFDSHMLKWRELLKTLVRNSKTRLKTFQFQLTEKTTKMGSSKRGLLRNTQNNTLRNP